MHHVPLAFQCIYGCSDEGGKEGVEAGVCCFLDRVVIQVTERETERGVKKYYMQMTHCW